MLSSFLSISSRRTASLTCTRRTLSALVSTESSESSSLFLLPTRHSRHAPPPTCLNQGHLNDLTQQVLEAGPGSLFTYERKHSFDAWSVQEVDEVIQKVEFLVRGHAARIPDTLWNRCFSVDTSSEDFKQRLLDMEALMKRIEKEGEDYVQLRKEMNAQLVQVEHQEEQDEEEGDFSSSWNDDDDDDDFDESTIEEAELMDDDTENQNIQNNETTSASPGVTVAMVDTYFDAMAVTPTGSCSPTELYEHLYSTVERYHADGGQESNTNIHTTPTILTFNAVLRAISTNLPAVETDEKTRDLALQLGLGVFDDMRHMVDRNSATYTYMLYLLEKCLPPSKSRGNIAHSFWMQASKRESVVDVNVMEAYRQVQIESGDEFVEWIHKNVPEDVKDVPLKFRRNAKKRRYQERDMTY